MTLQMSQIKKKLKLIDRYNLLDKCNRSTGRGNFGVRINNETWKNKKQHNICVFFVLPRCHFTSIRILLLCETHSWSKHFLIITEADTLPKSILWAIVNICLVQQFWKLNFSQNCIWLWVKIPFVGLNFWEESLSLPVRNANRGCRKNLRFCIFLCKNNWWRECRLVQKKRRVKGEEF